MTQDDQGRAYLLETTRHLPIAKNDRVVFFEAISSSDQSCPLSNEKTFIPLVDPEAMKSQGNKLCLAGHVRDQVDNALDVGRAGFERLCRGPFTLMAMDANCDNGKGRIVMSLSIQRDFVKFDMSGDSNWVPSLPPHSRPSPQVAVLEFPCKAPNE